MYCVPNLQLDLLAIDVNHASPKLHTNGQVMNRLKSFVCKLEEEARFANACVSYDDVLEQIPACIILKTSSRVPE